MDEVGFREINIADTPALKLLLLKHIKNACERVEPEMLLNCRTLRAALLYELREEGFEAEENYAYYVNGDPVGRVNILIKHPWQAAVQVDNTIPRLKSLELLRKIPGTRVVILRNPVRKGLKAAGIHQFFYFNPKTGKPVDIPLGVDIPVAG